MDMNETLKKVLTLLLVFVVIVVAAIVLLVVVMFIMDVSVDIMGDEHGVLGSAAMIVAALIIAVALMAKK